MLATELIAEPTLSIVWESEQKEDYFTNFLRTQFLGLGETFRLQDSI